MGTSFIVLVDDAHEVGDDVALPLPGGHARHLVGRQSRPTSGSHAQTVCGPYVSVRPYTCTGRKPSSLSLPSSVGDGGAPATAHVTGRASVCAFGSFTMPICTVGAPQ